MNILITGAWREAKNFISQLESMGHSVEFMQHQDSPLPCAFSWPEAVVCSTMFSYYDIEKFTNLKFIQCESAGIDHFPMDYIRQNNITFKNAPGVYSIPIAEYVVGGILQIYKDSFGFYKKQGQHKWDKNRELFELTNKNVFILGTGSIGTEIAKRLKAFDCKTIGFNRFGNNADFFDEVHSINNFKAIVKDADILISALPLDKSTKHLIDDGVLSTLKKDTVIVNVSRGAIVDTGALLKHINYIKGAVLDVFEDEPLPENSPL